MEIYVCGNILLEEDSIPLKILPHLKEKFRDINFIELDPTEDMPKKAEMIIIDTVINIDRVEVFEDIDRFNDTKGVSLHDFDLGMSLKLLKKMGVLKKVKIIGVPPKIKKEKAEEEIRKVITSLS